MNLRAAQLEVFRAAKARELRLFKADGTFDVVAARKFLMLWRRQGGKTTLFAYMCLYRMMRKAWELVTFASASLLVGGEVLEKEAKVLREAIDELRKDALDQKLKLESVDGKTGKSIDELGLADFTELYDKRRLEMRVHHSNTSYSRTIVIAPNPATARGWTGSVYLDEVGFVEDFKFLLEEVEPITSSDPTFNLLMATTLPKDDSHYAWEVTVPPAGFEMPLSASGRFYRSDAGLIVHRYDAWDAEKGGQKLYNDASEEIGVNEHRRTYFDREAWDRSYGLKHRFGGTCAISLTTIAMAQDLGRGKCLAVELDEDSDLPAALEGMLKILGKGKIGLGFDVATTENEQSNPSSLCVLEKDGIDFIPRLILRWKTNDPERATEIVDSVLDAIVSRPAGGRASVLAIDATNEKYFATALKRHLAGRIRVLLVVASETITHGSDEMTLKQFTGNNLVNCLEDGHFFLPSDRWLRNDLRLVFRDKGSFKNEADSNGNHGDCFDGCKLALYGMTRRGGKTYAMAAATGEYEAGTL